MEFRCMSCGAITLDARGGDLRAAPAGVRIYRHPAAPAAGVRVHHPPTGPAGVRFHRHPAAPV